MTDTTRRLFLKAGSATAVFGALAAAVVAEAAPSPLADAIARHQSAYAALDAACKATDEVILGRDATEPEWAAWGVASDAEEKALAALAALPCATDAERREKVAYVAGHLRRSHGRGWAGSPEEKALELSLDEWLGSK